MKVMKFGGTSVGSVKSILSLKSIVEAEAGRRPEWHHRQADCHVGNGKEWRLSLSRGV